MPKPEGYRKALRVMKLAEKFIAGIPLIDNARRLSRHLDAEERGQGRGNRIQPAGRWPTACAGYRGRHRRRRLGRRLAIGMEIEC